MKKVCKHGLNDIWINGADGEVRICGWTNYFLGKLTENSIEELWNGSLANEFRKSLLDGSYRYCNPAKCPYCANEKLEEHLVEYEVPEYPTVCNLSYQLQCNYSCKFCRESPYVSCECEKDNYIKIENEVKKILPHLKKLTANGAGEFFCSSSIINLLLSQNLDPQIDIEIETNGSLFTPENWGKIKKIGNHNLKIYVTLHSFDEKTYQFLSGTNMSVSQVIKNLKFISELRENNIVNEFEIATVICERNFRQVPEFVKKCLGEFKMDTIRLRFFEPYGVMDASTEWFYDIRNKYHPYHEEFESVMRDPILENEKVWKWQGETESLQKENPYVLEHRNYLNLAEMILETNLGEAIDIYLRKQKVSSIALWCAGKGGRAYLKLLQAQGILVDTIFDCGEQEKKETTYEIAYPTEDKVNRYDMIIITQNIYTVQVSEMLCRLSYKGIIKNMNNFVHEVLECSRE